MVHIFLVMAAFVGIVYIFPLFLRALFTLAVWCAIVLGIGYIALNVMAHNAEQQAHTQDSFYIQPPR